MLEVVNPYDLKPMGAVTLVEGSTVDAYLEQATTLSRRPLPLYERRAVLKRTITLMEERFETLAFQIAQEGGKPLVDARVEVSRAIDGVALCMSELLHLTGKEIPMGLDKASAGRRAFSTREPMGPVVAVSAFNHPLNLIVHQVAPAVAVGCPVLVKPAGDTPLSCQSFVQLLYEAGLPEEWCRYVPCNTKTAQRMVVDPRVAFFSFIGSARVGWMLRSQLAPGTRCSLEHGGVAPVIVDETADVEAMIPSLLRGGFYHSGQVCLSVQRVFVPHAMADTVAYALAEGAKGLKVGNAIEESTECGPLIRPAEVDRVAQWVHEAKAVAQVCSGGEPLGVTTYAPTVLLNPPMDAKVSTQEVFGPVVCVYGYDSLDQALGWANGLPFAFQASVFTKDLHRAMRCSQDLAASTVLINDHTAFRVDWMPFAGHRHSGYGVGGIGYTMHEMTQEKMTVIKLAL